MSHFIFLHSILKISFSIHSFIYSKLGSFTEFAVNLKLSTTFLKFFDWLLFEVFLITCAFFVSKIHLHRFDWRVVILDLLTIFISCEKWVIRSAPFTESQIIHKNFFIQYLTYTINLSHSAHIFWFVFSCLSDWGLSTGASTCRVAEASIFLVAETSGDTDEDPPIYR